MKNFETIKLVIEKEFTNVKVHPHFSELKYISFDFEGENIYCHFMKDNQIYHTGGNVTHCSSLSSDRPNEKKQRHLKLLPNILIAGFGRTIAKKITILTLKHKAEYY